MAHMQENPQTAGKDTRMPTGSETRQMPLRADKPARAAQVPYPLQGRPAPTQRIATPFAVPDGNAAFAASGTSVAPGAPGANAAVAAEAAEEEAPKRKGLGGLLEGLSVPQVAAGALAAVTSMLLSSKIGIAGSVIGVAVGSVVSTVASQVYKQFLQASADKLRELNPLDEAGAGAVAGETRVMPAAGEGSSATRVMGEMPASGAAAAPGDLAADGGPAASATPTRSVRDLRESGETGVLRGRAEHLRRQRMQRGVIAVSVVSALAAVAISAGVINLVTAGEGVGTKTEPLFTGTSTSQTDDGSTTKGKLSGKSQQSTQDQQGTAAQDSAAPVHQDGTASSDSSASGSGNTGGSSTSGTESGSTSGTGSSTGSTAGGSTGSGGTSGSQTGGSGSGSASGSGSSSSGSSSSGSTGTGSSSSNSGSTGSTGGSSSGSSTSGSQLHHGFVTGKRGGRSDRARPAFSFARLAGSRSAGLLSPPSLRVCTNIGLLRSLPLLP